MLTQLRFQNFKSWKDTGEIRMAPLTGLFGTNSSGKTAILQFLLMLKQTAESSDRERILNLGNNNTYIKLGNTLNIIHGNEIDKKIDFSIQWRPNRAVDIPLNLFESSSEDSLDKSKTDLLDIGENTVFNRIFSFGSSIYVAENELKLLHFCYRLESLSQRRGNVSCIASRPNTSVNSLLDNKFTFSFLLDETLKWEYLDEFEQFPTFKFYGFPALHRAKGFGDVLLSLNESFEAFFRALYYLGPLREYPLREYNWSGETYQDVGVRGENAISCILASNRDGNDEVGLKVSYWLKELGLISDFEIRRIAEGRQLYEAVVKTSDSSVFVPITDVGFGVSQILPVLTLCYYSPPGSIILFEQPEIHLHPAVQAKLADVFIDVIKFRGIQIIVESHSEHLLRRLQRRIAEEKLDNDSAALYFCNMGDDGASTLLPLELDTYGNINNWPKGFFGDEMGELFAMSEAAFERQMREEAAN